MMRRFIISFLILFFLVSEKSFAIDSLPLKPLKGISDSAQALSLSLTQVLERSLDEHLNLTQESILVLTLKNSPIDEDIDSFTVRVFNSWKVSTPKPPSSLVIVFDLERKRLSWKAGVGLDSLLMDRGATKIINEIVNPEFKAGRSDRAILLTLRRFFELLESPVFVNGKFDSDLKDSGFNESLNPTDISHEGRGWLFWFLGGFAISLFFGYRILAVEIHYTSAGWHRVSGWENLLRFLNRKIVKNIIKTTPHLKTGGGVSGSY